MKIFTKEYQAVTPFEAHGSEVRYIDPHFNIFSEKYSFQLGGKAWGSASYSKEEVLAFGVSERELEGVIAGYMAEGYRSTL